MKIYQEKPTLSFLGERHYIQAVQSKSFGLYMTSVWIQRASSLCSQKLFFFFFFKFIPLNCFEVRGHVWFIIFSTPNLINYWYTQKWWCLVSLIKWDNENLSRYMSKILKIMKWFNYKRKLALYFISIYLDFLSLN